MFNLIKFSSSLIAAVNETTLAFNDLTLASVVTLQLLYDLLSAFLSVSIYALIFFNKSIILSTESPSDPLLNST